MDRNARLLESRVALAGEKEPAQEGAAPGVRAGGARRSYLQAVQRDAEGPLPAARSVPELVAAPVQLSPDDQSKGGIGERIEGLARGVGDALMNVGGEAIGVAELAGFRYGVKTYEAQVSPVLYRGSRVDAQGMAALKAQGIRGIVNLCLENNDDAAPAAQLGLRALHVPILDNSPPSPAQVDSFLAFVADAGNQPVYVHCEAGKGRTGTMVACYRMAAEGWSADQAIAEAKQFGLAMPNQIAFLKEFGNRTNPPAPADAGQGPAAGRSE